MPSLAPLTAVILLLSASGCRSEAELPPPRAEVLFEAGLQAAWERVLDENPPPEGIELVPVHRDRASGITEESSPQTRLLVFRTGFAPWDEIRELALRKNTVVLEINAYVPAADLLDPERDVTCAEAA